MNARTSMPCSGRRLIPGCPPRWIAGFGSMLAWVIFLGALALAAAAPATPAIPPSEPAAQAAEPSAPDSA